MVIAERGPRRTGLCPKPWSGGAAKQAAALIAATAIGGLPRSHDTDEVFGTHKVMVAVSRHWWKVL